MSASPLSTSSTGRMLATCRKATCSRSPGADAVVAVAAEVVAGAAAGAVAAEGAAHAGDGAAGAELNGLVRGWPGYVLALSIWAWLWLGLSKSDRGYTSAFSRHVVPELCLKTFALFPAQWFTAYRRSPR